MRTYIVMGGMTLALLALGAACSTRTPPVPATAVPGPDIEAPGEAETAEGAGPGAGGQGGDSPIAETIPDALKPKIHPDLRARLVTAAITATIEVQQQEMVEVIISITDTLELPQFPTPNWGADAEDLEREPTVIPQATALIPTIEAERSPTYAAIQPTLEAQGAKISETYWLINAMRATIPLSSVLTIAALDHVTYIQPNDIGVAPPRALSLTFDTDTGNDPESAIAAMNAGALAGDSSLRGGSIGLIDTGVDKLHPLLVNQAVYAKDCVNSTIPGCTANGPFDPNDNCWYHGTSSAALLAGDGADSAHRGVTDILIRSYKVYPSSANEGICIGYPKADAVIGAFEASVLNRDTVILVQLQEDEDPIPGAIAALADHAFDQGAVVIAPIGNLGPDFHAASPGNAHKVLAIGAFDLVSGKRLDDQRIGYASDGRIKPDLMAPTNSETADAAPMNPKQSRTYGRTSGAAPYAAGLAALVWNKLRIAPSSVEPGFVYAFMILFGQNVYQSDFQPYGFTMAEGAGRIQSIFDGPEIFWTKQVELSSEAKTVTVPITIPVEAGKMLDAAIWWPERRAQAHNDIDLFIIDPNGITRASSVSCYSVFERASVRDPSPAGQWLLQISGPFLNDPREQTVYVAAALSNRTSDLPLPPADPKTTPCPAPIGYPITPHRSGPPDVGLRQPRPAMVGEIQKNNVTPCAGVPFDIANWRVSLFDNVGDTTKCNTEDVPINGTPAVALVFPNLQGDYEYSSASTGVGTPTPTPLASDPTYCIQIQPAHAGGPATPTPIYIDPPISPGINPNLSPPFGIPPICIP